MATTTGSIVTIRVNRKARKYINRLNKAADKLHATKRSKWHRVEDETPDSGRWVVVADAHGTVFFDWYSGGKWNNHTVNAITHWREIPKCKDGDQ